MTNYLIYIPEDNTYNKCYVVQSEGVIRGYDRVPAYNSSYNYRDYYINSDYIYRDGTGSWNNYSNLPICLDSDILTNDYLHRVDLANILLIFLVFNIFGIFLPIKLFSTLITRRL